MDENLTLDDPSALDAPVEDTQPSLILNVPEASPTVYPVQQASNPLDKVSADIAAKRSALAALPPVQQRVIDLSRIWTAPTETPKPQDFASYAGEKYSVLDTAAKQSVWDGYVRSELPKSLPAGYTPEQLAAAKARFEASNPRPQDTGFYSYLKSGVASTMNAVSSAVSTKTPETLARATIANIKDQIDDPEIAALQKNIAQQVKDAGGSTLWNELKVRTAEYATNPRLFAKMAIQQLPNSIPSMAGAIAGAAVGAKTGAVAGGTAGTFVIPGIGTVGGGAAGGVIGGAVGGVMGSFLMGAAPEVGSELLQRIQTEAQAAGVNVTNKPALEAFIAERGVDHFVAPSVKKGVVTAGVDSLYNAVIVGRLGSVASKQAKVILKTEADLAKGVITAEQAAVNLAKAQGRVAAAQTPLAKATHAAGTAGIETLGEGTSEAAGRFYADNRIDWSDVADEMLFGFVQGTTFEAGGKVWSAATGAASEYDQAVAKLNARLAPPAMPSATAAATPPAATDTTLTPEAPAAEPTATDTTPVLPTIDDAAIARLKEIVPDFNETANITENGALSLDPDQTAALQQVIENLPAADQQFLYDLALGVNANETTSTKTDPAANQQAAISAQETIPGSTASASSDPNGVSGLPADGSGASTGAVLDGRPASENRTDTGPATSEVVGGPVVDNVNTTSTEGTGSPGTDGTGTTPAVTTQGNENATSQINQQESVQQQRSPGDQARQTPEAGRRDRVQRAEQNAAPQEKVATQNVTEGTLDTLRLRAEEVLSRLSTEETISVRDYFEQVQPPDDGGKVSIRTDMRKLLGELEARVEQGDAALRAGKQALTADEVRALHDEVAGGIVYATTEELAKNVPVDALVERALRNNDARGALTVMSRTASTPLARAVSSRLLSQVSPSTKVAVAPVDNVDTAKLNGRKASGSYHPGTNTLTLDPEANGLTERTVLHEVTHAATIEAIRNPDTAVKRAAVKELQRIMDYAKKSLPGVRHYGFTNLEEFVAEAFSNPVFQRDLYNIKTGPKVSLWSRIVNAVLKSTGLDKIIGLVNDDNLLGKTLTAADLLMQPASAKATENTSAVAAEEPPSTEALAAPTDLAAQTETDLAALQGGRKPTIGIQNESVGTKLRTLKAAAREALIDYQVPIYNWLESIYGVGKAATNATWQTLKTIGPKRDELNHQFKTGTLHDINMVGKELATKYGLKIEEAVSTLGEYAKYVHVPEANATLLARLQKAANDANADLRNATTDLALAQQEYDQAKLDVKSKKAPVANAKTFSRADAELKQATKAYNDAVKTRDAADAALQAGPDRQAGHLTDAQAQDSKAYLESKYDVALLQKGQQLLVKANRDALDASVRAGVIDAKTAASLKATYPNYVPLFVDKDSLGTDPWSAMDGAPDLFSQSINATLIKERKGYLENSDVRSDNAYINTIAKVAATNSRVAAQPFKNQLLVMALNKDAGKELSIKPLRGNNPDPRGMVAKDSKGQQYQVMFKSDQLADAVYSRGVEEFGSTGLPGMIASVGSIIARSVTQYTLAFAPVNLVRDVGEKTLLVRSRKFLDANGKPVDGRALAGTMTKLLATDFLNIITSINQAVRDKAPATPGKYYDLIKEMMSEGGLSTWGDIFQKSRIEVLNEVKKLQGWRRLPTALNDVVHKYNHTFDMMSSTLAYAAMKQAGMTPRAAAFATMDLMNFRNKGKKTGWIRALYLFANPALQSGANFIDHVKTKQGKIDAVVLGVLALAIYQLALMTGDDDELLGNEIDQRNTTEIERSMVFMVDGVPVKVPVPYGMAQIMWAFAVNGTRFARGVTSGADALADSIKSTFKSISPISPSEIEATKNPLMFMVQTLTPSTLRPIVDVATNTSAFGAPITKPRLNPKIPASAQGRENTEGFWKDTAKKLYETTGADVAPEKIKALWLGFTAGPIADATKAITFDKDEKGLTTSFRDDLRYLMPLGFNRIVGGDSTFLQAKYYDSLKQAENLVKKYGLAEVDSNRTLGTGGKAAARKAILDKAPGITDNDKKLVAAYYAERLIVTKEGQSKKKDLSRAKTPESIADINSKYEDASEARMRDFLSRLK